MFMMQLDNTWHARCIRHGPVQIIYNISICVSISPRFFRPRQGCSSWDPSRHMYGTRQLVNPCCHCGWSTSNSTGGFPGVMGVPLAIINSKSGFSIQPSSSWGTPIYEIKHKWFGTLRMIHDFNDKHDPDQATLSRSNPWSLWSTWRVISPNHISVLSVGVTHTNKIHIALW